MIETELHLFSWTLHVDKRIICSPKLPCCTLNIPHGWSCDVKQMELWYEKLSYNNIRAKPACTTNPYWTEGVHQIESKFLRFTFFSTNSVMQTLCLMTSAIIPSIQSPSRWHSGVITHCHPLKALLLFIDVKLSFSFVSELFLNFYYNFCHSKAINPEISSLFAFISVWQQHRHVAR